MAKLKAPPKAARPLQGSGRLPSPENLINKSADEVVRILNRFGIEPDTAGIDARGKRAMARFDRLLEEGVMPDDATMEALKAQNEREFVDNLRKMAKQAIRLYRLARIANASPLLMWVTSGRDNVCNSCEPRHGTVRTLKQWQRLGLPGSAALLCSENCNCQLVPAQ